MNAYQVVSFQFVLDVDEALQQWVSGEQLRAGCGVALMEQTIDSDERAVGVAE